LKDFLAAETQTVLSRRRRRCLKQLIKISAADAENQKISSRRRREQKISSRRRRERRRLTPLNTISMKQTNDSNKRKSIVSVAITLFYAYLILFS
jgi:hypothetical protein